MSPSKLAITGTIAILIILILDSTKSEHHRSEFHKSQDHFLQKQSRIKAELEAEIAEFHKYLGADCDLDEYEASMVPFWDAFFNEALENFDEFLNFTMTFADIYVTKDQKLNKAQHEKAKKSDSLLVRRYVDINNRTKGIGEWYIPRADQLKIEAKRCISGGLLECRPYPSNQRQEDKTKGYCTCMDNDNWVETTLVKLDEEETYLGTVVDYEVEPEKPEGFYKGHICAIKPGARCFHYTPYTGGNTFQCTPGYYCHPLLRVCICPINVEIETCLNGKKH